MKREIGCLRPMVPSLSRRLPSTNSRPVRPSVKRLEFDTRVWLEKPPSSGDWKEIYSFTSMQNEHGAAPITLEDLHEWQELYPDLAKVHQTCGKIDGELIAIQATFKLEEMPAKSHLGIQVFLDVAHTAGYSMWKYSSRFYNSSGKVIYLCSNDLRSSAIRGSSRIRLEIPLESKWWVNVLWKFSRQRSTAIAQGTSEALQLEERRTRRELQGISISQEIFATDAFGCERRLTTLLWRFDQIVGSEVATTVWRKVIQHDFWHAPSSPKVEEYEDLHANDPRLMETIPAQHDEKNLLLSSVENAQGRQEQQLEWFNQTNDPVEQGRLELQDDLFNINQTHQLAHSQESQYVDDTVGTTETPGSQPFDGTIWEHAPCAYPTTYEDQPYDYQTPPILTESVPNHPVTEHTVEEHCIYEDQASNHRFENFTGGEICLQYGLDESHLHLKPHLEHPGEGLELHDLGLAHSHGNLHILLGNQEHAHELVLDPAFNDPNHAINNIYNYPTPKNSLESSRFLEQHSFPPKVPEIHSPNQQEEYQPPAVNHSQILPSQPDLHDNQSESSISQSHSAVTELSIPSQSNELMFPSQSDPKDQAQAIDSLHFEDDWDPNLVPHLFDGPDFHAAVLEILGTEIALPETQDFHAIGFHTQEPQDSRDYEHAQVLGEIGVDIGVDEAKDWVLVKGLDGLDGHA